MQVKHPVVEGRGDGAETGLAPANTTNTIPQPICSDSKSVAKSQIGRYNIIATDVKVVVSGVTISL